MSTSAGGKKPPGWIGSYAPKLEAARGDKPMDMLLGWIAQESGGKLAELTSLDERGLFQVHPDESKGLGLTPEQHKALSSDVDLSINTGLRLIDQYSARAAALGIPRDNPAHWYVVKFLHAMGSGAVGKLFADMIQHGIQPSSWEVISDYGRTEEARLFSLLKHSPTKWIGNVDSVFLKGKLLAIAAGVLNPRVAIPLVLGLAAVIAYLMMGRSKRMAA